MRVSDDASSRSQSRSRRAATSRIDRLWDYGVIPYEIDSNFSGNVTILTARWSVLLQYTTQKHSSLEAPVI